MIKDWLEKVKDPYRDVYDRRYRLLSMISIVLLTLWILLSVFISPVATKLRFFTLTDAAFLPCYYIALRYDKSRLIAKLSALWLVFAMVPVAFFLNGGVGAGAPNWCLIALIYILMTVEGGMKGILVVSDIAVVVLCYLVSYLHPEFVLPYNRITAYLDSMASLTIVSVMAVSMLLFQMYMARQEKEILEAQRLQIEELNTAQNRFFSSMSHEIRTPINTIIGMNELILRDRSVSDEIIYEAKAIEGASGMLLSLINDILDKSKMESGKMEIVPVTYDTGALFSGIVDMFRGRAEEKGLRFLVDIDPSLPARLIGDEVRIRQVLVNLLGNAVKYTREGSVSFSVQGDRVSDRQLHLTVRVEDTGIGIKKEALPYLFDAFRRVDEKENRFIEGTGLGLSIVKQLADLMQGELTVSSIYTKGSTFSFSLMQEIADAEAGNTIQLRERHEGEGRVFYKQSFEAPRARVLIVDDNEMNLQVEVRLLAGTKIGIDTAPGGAEALQKSLETRYDVIFMDHLMPGMDGIACLKALREQEGGLNRETPVIVLTANAGSENQAMYAASGFDGYLLKPVSGQQLEEALIRILPENLVMLTGNATMQSEKEAVFGQHNRKRGILVTMDSAGDLPREWRTRMQIPMINYLVKTDSGIFRDNVEIDADELLLYMEDPAHRIGSEPPGVEQFTRFFGIQLSKAQHIIHITVSRSISKSYENAMAAAASFDNVTVVDSGTLSCGTGMLALYAARLSETQIFPGEALERIRRVREQIRMGFVLENADRAIKSGHLSVLAGAVADTFLLHPLISIKDGKLRAGFMGYRDYTKRFIRHILRRAKNPDPSLLFIIYAGMREEALAAVVAEVEKLRHFDRVVLMKASSAIAANCGSGSLGLMYRERGTDRETAAPLFDFLPLQGTGAQEGADGQQDAPGDLTEGSPAAEEAAAASAKETAAAETESTAGAAQTGGTADTGGTGAGGTADISSAEEIPAADRTLPLDRAQGIVNCGSEAAYESVLKMFYDSAAGKADEIEGFFAAEDWENFTIRVHALKSSARLIGASALSEAAADLEALGNKAREEA